MSLIPPAQPLQRLLPASEDTSNMSQRQRFAFIIQRAVAEDLDEFDDGNGGLGPKAYIRNLRESLPVIHAQLVMKIIGSAKEQVSEKKAEVIDFPWLHRSRLAYKDPERRAQINAEDSQVVIEDAVMVQR